MTSSTTRSCAPPTTRPRDGRPALTAAWFAGPLIGIANGAARDVLYKDRLGERAAQHVSTPLVAGLAAYFAWLDRRWPLPDARTAWVVGGMWAALTMLFEFGIGHYVARDSWADLIKAYDVSEGQTWVLVPLWLGAGPAVVRAFRAH